MAVMAPMPREKWTDERLDDLNKKVGEGFARVEGEIKRLYGDVRRLEGNLGELRREINARFESMDLRFDSLHQSLRTTMVAVIVALIGSNAFF